MIDFGFASCLIVLLSVLSVSLVRAFGRIAELEHAGSSLRERIGGLEDQLAAIARGARKYQPERAPEPVRPPQPATAPATFPPRGGGYEAPSSDSRDVRLLDHRSLGESGQAEEGPAQRTAASSLSFRLQPETEAADSIETTIGSRWLLYVGIVAIVIGVAYFEKLAIDNQWLGETARVIQGGIVGLLLTYAGLRFVRAGYSVYGQMMTGGGAAILYLSTFAAFNYYHLIDQPAAFGLMVAITAMVAWLADRHQSQGLALFAVGGGFAAPFLVPGTTDAQIALFGYDTILIGATTWLSRRRSWPVLNIVSYVATLATVATWADSFYTPEKYLRTELFLTLFCAMFLYILRQVRTSPGRGAEGSALVLWTAPVAYYVASVMVLQDHSTALLVWLVALMLIGGMLSERVGPGAGLGVWGAVTVPLLLWTVAHQVPLWYSSGLSTIAAVYLIALAAQLRRTFADPVHPPDLGVADIVWLHLNGLLMFAIAYFLINETHVASTGAMAAAFALWQGGLAAAVWQRQRDQALHFAALGFTLVSIAIALQWDGPAVTIGWAAEGAVIVALGLFQRRQWLRGAGLALFTVAFGQTIALLTTGRAVSEAAFFNRHAAAAAAVAALCYVIAWLHHRDPEAPDREVAIGTAVVVAQITTLALLTTEIHAYWALGEGYFARELMVSVTWSLYATVLIVIGLRKAYAPIRYFAIVVFSATIFKVFVLDMADLERIYRVASIIGLGILLLLTSYLYTRSKRA